MINSLNSNISLTGYSLNIKNNVNSNASASSSANVETKEQSSSNKKVLGYTVDKDGYFTEEFNKVAGIPEDYKIHSSSMESLARAVNPSNIFRAFKSIDVAKTIGNAYKVLSQVVGEDVLTAKNSFTLDEIAKFPQGYEYNNQTMQVTSIHKSVSDYVNAELNFNWNNGTGTQTSSLFFNTSLTAPSTDIFNNHHGGKELGVAFNSNGDKYTNADGSITKGGLLVAVVNANIYTQEGETTISGKMQGFDKSLSVQEAKNIERMLGFNGTNTLGIVADTKGYFALLEETDMDSFRKKYAEFLKSNKKELERIKREGKELEENYKDPLTIMFEEMEKAHKEHLEHIKKKKQEEKEKTRKLDITA
ncbi:Cj0814 family flagellar-dependent secreted protein [Helicobacter turcicus]|uniref:Uncharacterized protein n=1 Tax=Helicobacter turcicus TaxID=2867412 RepID=A0ABS7JM83_9HELI|nr:hypothetical protein [Helicobacter turcicus]MBX7490500.1 hypothetical protein [Helicobacter turcicus]MBX7545360.1 hypothetical protein [Helicobacter turcicus]